MKIYMNYRDAIHNNSVVAEESDVEKCTDFLTLDDVEQLIDDIESKVNEVKEMLDKITGLTEIDEIKELVDKLSKDLY